MSDLRSKILQSKDLLTEDVYVPQWDVTVRVQGMSAGARGSLIDRSLDKKTGDMDYNKLYPLLLVDTVFDPETDEQVFSIEDIPELLKKSGAALEAIGTVALRLGGFDDEAAEGLGKPS